MPNLSTCAKVWPTVSEYTIQYYNKRVKAAIAQLPKGILADYIRITKRMQVVGPDLGMPDTRAMGNGLFEARPEGEEGWGRVLYCTMKGRKIVMLHCFLRKTRTTPKSELETGRRGMREAKNGTMQPIE